LSQQEPDLKKIITTIPVPVFYQDTRALILGCNSAFALLVGQSTEQVIGRSFSELISPDARDLHQHADEQILRNRKRLKYYVTTHQKGREIHYVVRKDIFKQDDHDVIVGVLIDITQQEEAERRLHHQATHDALTGLTNRHEMQGILKNTDANARRYERPYSILLIDMDRFKMINDNLGHGAGDIVLRTFAEIADNLRRESDTLARWGGEEFIFLLPNTDSFHAANVAERVRSAIDEKTIQIGEQALNITVSIGVASYPEDSDKLEDLLSMADAALFEAKRSGRNRVMFSNKNDSGIFSIGTQMQRALEEGRLKAAYQPIVDLQTRELRAEEALARIILKDGKVSDAEAFIQAASDLQLSHKIDHLITSRAIKRHLTESRIKDKVQMFVNISADLLRHPELTDDLIRFTGETCRACGITDEDVKPIVIEITEREFLGNIHNAREALDPLIQFGLKIAIDDFGSGYSSFQYLADLPVSYLKIEGTLIKRMRNEPKVKRIIQGIRDVAKDLELITIAEHIEDEETAQALTELGIDWGQGFLFGRAEIED